MPAPAAAALEVVAHRSPAAFRELLPEWIDLEDHAGDDNIFLTYTWQHAWWQELGGDRRLALTTFRDGGRLVAIAPIYEETVDGQTLMRFGGGLEVTDYMGFLIEPGYERAVGEAFVVHCLEVAGLVLDFHFLRADSATLRALTEATGALGLPCQREEEEVSPRIRLPASWDAYLGGLSKKNRHELRRKRRRLEEAGGWTVENSQPATLARDLEVFFALHSGSTRAKADFLTDETKDFFRHISVHLQDSGWLSLRTLTLKGEAVAAVLGFVYRGKLLLYNSGYDPRLTGLSPGFVLMSEEIRLAIEEGLEEVDFLRGSEKYKYDLGATDVPLIHLRVEPG